MRHTHIFILLIALLAISIGGCSREEPSLSPTLPQISGASLSLIGGSITSNDLNNYNVHFDGRVFDGLSTTFSYTLSGLGGMHALSFFLLELPSCAGVLQSSSPSGGTVGVDPHTGLYSIKWTTSLGVNDIRSYSITFPGDVPLGVITVAVKASTELELGEIAGPCAGFEISGTVYVDADSNGVRAPAESGIADVTVTLVDSNGYEQSDVTGADGRYTFLRVAGDYTVRIDALTDAIDFNEELDANFNPSGPTSAQVTTGPDSYNNDFGYDPKAQEIIYNLEVGTLLTDGEPVKFWVSEVRSALRGGQKKARFPLDQMEQFMVDIQELFLDDPFSFTPGNEFQEALDILTDNNRDNLTELRRQLLAAEFNEVSGKGLVGADELQRVLLAWAEAVEVQLAGGAPAAVARPAAAAAKGYDGPSRVYIAPDAEVTDLLTLLNGAVGGGGGGEGGR